MAPPFRVTRCGSQVITAITGNLKADGQLGKTNLLAGFERSEGETRADQSTELPS